jgi:hypothetical protein
MSLVSSVVSIDNLSKVVISEVITCIVVVSNDPMKEFFKMNNFADA